MLGKALQGIDSIGIVVGPGLDGVEAIRLSAYFSMQGMTTVVILTRSAARFYQETVFRELAGCRHVFSSDSGETANVDLAIVVGGIKQQERWDEESVQAVAKLNPNERIPVVWIEEQPKINRYISTVSSQVRLQWGKLYGDLTGIQVLVTGGGTREPIDPVRQITNRSSGKMGLALAQVFRDRGADVVFITANRSMYPVVGTKTLYVDDTDSLRETVLEQCGLAPDVLVMSAAVSDYKCKVRSQSKLKKTGEAIKLDLVQVQNFIPEVPAGILKVGFAAETDADLEKARKKCIARGFDFICLNDVSRSDIGFDVDQNQVTMIDPEGVRAITPLASKYEVGWQIADEVLADLSRRKKG